VGVFLPHKALPLAKTCVAVYGVIMKLAYPGNPLSFKPSDYEIKIQGTHLSHFLSYPSDERSPVFWAITTHVTQCPVL
jgi:hypothetical protein